MKSVIKRLTVANGAVSSVEFGVKAKKLKYVALVFSHIMNADAESMEYALAKESRNSDFDVNTPTEWYSKLSYNLATEGAELIEHRREYNLHSRDYNQEQIHFWFENDSGRTQYLAVELFYEPR